MRLNAIICLGVKRLANVDSRLLLVLAMVSITNRFHTLFTDGVIKLD